MKHKETNCDINFSCDKWISVPDGNLKEDFVLELPVIRPDVAPLEGPNIHIYY